MLLPIWLRLWGALGHADDNFHVQGAEPDTHPAGVPTDPPMYPLEALMTAHTLVLLAHPDLPASRIHARLVETARQADGVTVHDLSRRVHRRPLRRRPRAAAAARPRPGRLAVPVVLVLGAGGVKAWMDRWC